MRGVKCSWKEMQRLHREVLPALTRGDDKRYAELRCVEPSTVTKWKRASEVMAVLEEEKCPYGHFEHFQPTHAHAIARIFRKRKKPPWDDDTKEQIRDWVERCEGEQMTVEDLRFELSRESANGSLEKAISLGVVGALSSLVAEGTKFGAIYADPPWAYSNKATRSNVETEYEGTMTVEQICAEPVAELAAAKAHLHLWTTNAFLFEAQKVMAAWGFEYKSCFVWVKPQLGIGNYWRVSHEFMLLGVRGGLRFRDRGQISWICKDRGTHSSKPQEVRKLVELVSPGPYLEMYGRRRPGDGWTVYGNEVQDEGLLP